MAATLEVKYFNTFWLKKIKSITDVKTTNIGATNTAVDTTIILIPANTIGIGAGRTVTNNTNTTGFASGAPAQRLHHFLASAALPLAFRRSLPSCLLSIGSQ